MSAGIALLLLSSCEKVIDVKLRDSEKKYVVEGFLSDAANGAEVRVSQTKSFSSSNSFNGVSGAVILLTSNTGASYSFTETTPGIYKTAAFAGTPGTGYQLTVKVGGQTFAAASVMPAPVPLDSLFVETFTFGPGGNSKIVDVVFDDPVTKGNAYRFRNWVNRVEENVVYVQNDDYYNGNQVISQLINGDSKIKTGDSILVEMQCIDREVYKYWKTLSDLKEGNSATPANPTTNFSGGCLGYFSAYAATRKAMKVQ